MGIFSGLFKSRDKPTDSTVGSRYTFYMGGSTSGKTVTERSAMQMTAVYSCVRILSEAVAGLPLHLYKYTDSGGKAMALDHSLYRLLHDEPNPEMSSFVFRETLMTHLLLWGNAYAQIIRNGKNEIVALYPLMPNKMSVDRDENGRLYYTYYRGSDEAIKNKEFAVTLQPSDVLHIPGLGFDGLVGYSPIAMAKNAIGMAIACEEYAANHHRYAPSNQDSLLVPLPPGSLLDIGDFMVLHNTDLQFQTWVLTLMSAPCIMHYRTLMSASQHFSRQSGAVIFASFVHEEVSRWQTRKRQRCPSTGTGFLKF